MTEKPNKTTPPSAAPLKEELQVHIRITENGEICAWGLDQKGEEKIYGLTGNLDLINRYKAMSFNLCG